MTVRLDGDLIRLEGDCHVEQAETLVQLLHDHPAGTVDLEGCGRLHSAVVQALLALRPAIRGRPADAFVRDWLVPNFRL